MATLTMRPFMGERDLRPIVDLANVCEAVDQLDEPVTLDEIRTDVTAPSFDQARDVRLWDDSDGKLAAVAMMFVSTEGEPVDGFLWFRVHPAARGDLETQIIAWGEERMREVARERGKPTLVRARARADQPAQIALLERHGFAAARYSLRMDRPLDEAIPEPRFPAGYTLRRLAGDHEVEEWVACFNESFVDHYNHHPWRPEDRRHRMTEPSYRPEHDLVAVAPDGRIAGFCWCGIFTEENALTGRNEGWIALLGTRRGHRRIGLGRALLLAGLHRLKADGVESAALGVDAQSLTGANLLYESAGFRTRYTYVTYAKPV